MLVSLKKKQHTVRGYIGRDAFFMYTKYTLCILDWKWFFNVLIYIILGHKFTFLYSFTLLNH